MPTQPNKPLSNTEWIVINAVYRACEEQTNVTVSEVIDALGGKKRWNQSTVKTILERLVAKAALTSQVRGRVCFYETVHNKENIARTDIAARLDAILEGAMGPLVSYLADRTELSKKEIETLEKLLKDKE